MKVGLLTMVAAGALAAQAPSPAPPADGPKQAISGRLLDSETGRPLRGAKITIMHDRGELASAQTDFEGRFKIDETPVGEWRIGAEKSGYMNNFELLVVPAAQPLSGLELRLHRQSAITGRVVDRHNRPVVGARVDAYVRRYLEGESAYFRQGGRGSAAGETDDRGQYRIWGLTAGSYILAVYPAPLPAAEGVFRFSSAGVIYSSTQLLSEAEKIDLDWGEVREGLDLRLAAPAATRAEAQLAFPGESSCQPCFAQLFIEDPDGLIEVAGSPVNGARSLIIEGAPPGRYLALVRGYDRATSSSSSAMASFTLSEGRTETLPIAMSGEVPVKGRVVLENPPADLFADGRKWRAGLRLMPPPNLMQLGMSSRGMFTNLEASGPEVPFELTVFPGSVRLKLMGQEGYIAGMSLDGRPVDSRDLTIPPGGLHGELVVRVSFESGKIEGSIEGVSPGPPAPGLGGPLYVVTAHPVGASSPFREQRFLRVRPDGGFSESLPPGSWDILALERTSFQSLADPAHQPALRKFTRRVEIRPNETATVTLPLAPQR